MSWAIAGASFGIGNGAVGDLGGGTTAVGEGVNMTGAGIAGFAANTATGGVAIVGLGGFTRVGDAFRSSGIFHGSLLPA